MKSYTAEVHREGRRWLIAYVPEIDSTTQGRDLAEVDFMVRDLIRMHTEDDTPVEVVIKVEDPHLQEELEAARVARREAAVAAERAAEQSRTAALGLKTAGFTVRDIGALLGVTFQRAHQLVTSARRGRPA